MITLTERIENLIQAGEASYNKTGSTRVEY